ncbi:MAG: (Fe-S)-binding protein [Candidatus Hermodarchaeota archaeon]
MVKLIYLGCLSQENYNSTCENAIKMIKYLDTEYQVLKNTPCCGSLTYHISTDEELKNHVQYVNKWFNENNVKELVTICAGCYSYLTKYYNEFLGDDFKVKVKHLLQILAEPENLKKLNLKYSEKKITVNYHDACHLRNAPTPIIEEPRTILNATENIDFNEMEFNKKSSICCGAGGGVYSIFKENSDFNAKSIFEHMKESKILLTACPFCYTALRRIKEENNLRQSVMKFEDFIINLIDGGVGIS